MNKQELEARISDLEAAVKCLVESVAKLTARVKDLEEGNGPFEIDADDLDVASTHEDIPRG